MLFNATTTCKIITQHLRRITTAAPHTEHRVLVGNLSINYVQAGSGNRSLLLMPGALGSAWTDFRPQIEKLPKHLPDYTIIAWDPPGYGKSQPPLRNFTVDFFEQDARAANRLMQKLGHEHYSVLGWSDGGITGMILSAAFPHVVEKLVFWGANSYVLPEELKIYEGIRDVLKWSPKMREPMEQIYGAENFAKLWSAWVDVFGKISRINKGNICSNDLCKIEAPTLILHGAKDPMIAAEHIPFLRKHIKNVEYHEFENGKHNIHLKYADEFNKIVAEFLRK